MEHKHLFITGLHRSGTSLLHRLVCEYENVSGFSNTGVPEDEGQHLQNVFKAANQFGGAGKFAFEKECHMDEHHPLVNEASHHKLMSQWSKYWDMKCTVLVEKSPPTMIRSRFFQVMFPNSYFIFIRRHPIAVSMATSKWADSPLPRLMEHWVKAHQLMEADKRELKNVLELTYEELTENPSLTMQKVERFLGLPHVEHTLGIKAGINDKYFATWNREIGDEVMSDDIVRECERLGYPL